MVENRDKSQAKSARVNKKEFERVWHNPSGIKRLTIVNHTNIGIRYLITGSIFFLIGGLLGLVIRTQLARPNQELIGPQLYNQLFTMHGTIMMFLFAVPILEGLSMYLVPKMIGARDLVFPRLSAFGYFCYVFGGLMLMFSLIMQVAPDTGWFMYTPLSSRLFSPGLNPDFWLLGVTLAEVSALTAAVELVVSIMRTRTCKMSLTTMPLFCWYILVMALMIIFGFPPLILGSILLELERAANLPFFDPTRGGDPILWQHLFWLFGHPEVYIIFLPAAGIVSTLIPVFARRPIVGYHWIVVAIITTGFISFGLWVHHMFTVGIPNLAMAFFSVASMLVAIPTGIQIFAWIATLWTGKPRFEIPMLWITGFLFNFILGGFTGVMLALVPFDWQVHDTHFVVAHLHYVLIGGMFFPLVAGLYYWLPHFSGRMPSWPLANAGFWFTFIGFNLTFFIMHLTGLLGMPRRVYTYEANLGWDLPNLISSIGAFVFALGVFLIILDVLTHFRIGKAAKPNPWNSDTLEWATALPPKNYNFISLPPVTSRTPLWDNNHLANDMDKGQYLLADARSGLRETLGTDAVTAKVREIIVLPGNSWLPFTSACLLFLMFANILVRSYYFACLMGVFFTFAAFRWAYTTGLYALEHVKLKKSHQLLLHPYTKDGPGLWGMAVSLLADATIYMSLLFGWLYILIVVPNNLTRLDYVVPWGWYAASGILLAIGSILYHWTIKNSNRKMINLMAVTIGAFLHLVLLGIVFWSMRVAATASAANAIVLALLLYQCIHSVLIFLMMLQLLLRTSKGYVSHEAPGEFFIIRQFWMYTVFIFWISFIAIIILPSAIGS